MPTPTRGSVGGGRFQLRARRVRHHAPPRPRDGPARWTVPPSVRLAGRPLTMPILHLSLEQILDDWKATCVRAIREALPPLETPERDRMVDAKPHADDGLPF